MSLRVQLARIKRKLLQKPWLKDKQFPGYWCDTLLGGKSAQVVQIGSNDGKTGDPLFELFQKHRQWNGLFVEPVPYLFQRLKSNYRDAERFRFENAAIGTEEQPLTFYWVDPKARETLPDLPYWYDQLGSFNKNRIAEELDGKLLPFMLSAELESIRLETLLQRHSIQHIDLLHIDTEGYDWNILSQLPIDRIAPTFIMFEYNHLSEADVAAAKAFLAVQYTVFNVGIDLFAVNNSVGSATLTTMKQHLQPA